MPTTTKRSPVSGRLPPPPAQVTLTKDDFFFVLACDGVWDVMSNQDVVDFVSRQLREARTPADAAANLLDACLASNPRDTKGIGCDNMTAIIICLKRELFGDGGPAGGASRS